MEVKYLAHSSNNNTYIVGDSVYKPQTLDQSDAIFNIIANKDFTKRIRKVDIERQQEELRLAQMQGQGDTRISTR